MTLDQEIDGVRQQLQQDLSQINPTQATLETLRIRYLGKKGIVPALFRYLPKLAVEERPDAGQMLNQLKNETEKALDDLHQYLIHQQENRATFFDYTLPGKRPPVGHLHPVTRTMNAIIDIFRRMGFSIAFGPEIETDYNNFQALNFPDNHPARDMQDTFFIDRDILLRTHTSPIQVRTMLQNKPPIRILAPGRVYRNEAINPRSYCMFHQIEGLYVDEQVTFAELKTTLDIFAKQFFGAGVKTRLRPSFFPFTEPSAEMDISCFICGGSGCRVCKQTGWLEILGCGMVDPNVFRSVGIDPEKYTGYAFGMGPDRISLLKYGIDDIRLLFEGDIRFLNQF